MSEIQAVSSTSHANRAWNKAAGFGWARGEIVAGIARMEAMQLMMTLPLGFIRQQDQYQFVVLMGLRKGENLMIATDGRWQGARVPEVLQFYPFRVLHTTDGQYMLGVDEAGLLPLGTVGGTPLFVGEKPASELTAILEQLIKLERHHQQTRQMVASLAAHDLIEPWNIQTPGDTAANSISGLYRVSENKLNEVDADALKALRDSGALVVAYCQLLSMQHIHQLSRMSEARLRSESVAADHGIISFANL